MMTCECGHEFELRDADSIRHKCCADPPKWEYLTACPKCGSTDVCDKEKTGEAV